MGDGTAGLGLPGDAAVRLVPRLHRVEFNRHAGGTGDGPVSVAVLRTVHLRHVAHEARKVLVVAPEVEDLVSRRVDRDRLVNVDAATATPNTEQTPDLQIHGRPSQEQEPAETGCRPDKSRHPRAIPAQCRADAPTDQPRRRRPVLLHELRPWPPVTVGPLALQAGNIARRVVNFQSVIDARHASRSARPTQQTVDFMREDRPTQRHAPGRRRDVERARMAHDTPDPRTDSLDQYLIAHVIAFERRPYRGLRAAGAVANITRGRIEGIACRVRGADDLVTGHRPAAAPTVRVEHIGKRGSDADRSGDHDYRIHRRYSCQSGNVLGRTAPALCGPAKRLSQLALGRLQARPLRARQPLSPAVDVVVQHRHRGLELRASLGAPALRDGALQPLRDRARRAREDPTRKIHRVRRFLNSTHPASPTTARMSPSSRWLPHCALLVDAREEAAAASSPPSGVTPPAPRSTCRAPSRTSARGPRALRS